MGEQPEELHCPKCGGKVYGAYALLGHTYTEHWVVDDAEIKGETKTRTADELLNEQ